MAQLSKAAAHHRARIGSLSRDRAPDDPELIAAKRDYWTERTAAYIEKVLAQAPPLTDEQRTRLAELLAPVRQGGTAIQDRLDRIRDAADLLRTLSAPRVIHILWSVTPERLASTAWSAQQLDAVAEDMASLHQPRT